MITFDIVLLIIAGLVVIKGFTAGLIRQASSLLALGAGILFCPEVAAEIQALLGQWGFLAGGKSFFLSYSVAFVAIVSGVKMAGDRIGRLIDDTPLGLLNHLGGAVLGLVLMVLFSSVALRALEWADKDSRLISRETKVESRFYGYLVKLGEL